MRTKKLLSVLLAALLAIGVFGVVSAGAIDDAAYAAAAAEASELAAQAASIGYPSFVEIVTDSSLLGRWDANVLVWTVFTRSAAGVADGYDDLKRAGNATVKWKVWTYDKDGNRVAMNDPATNEATAVLRDFAVYTGSTSTQERLYIKQGKTPYYGKVDIEMTLWVAGKTPDLVATKTITLVDQTAFQDLLNDAQKILDKSDRYAKAYLDDLRNVRNAARFYLSADPTDPNFETLIKNVTETLEQVIKDAEDNYKLTDLDLINRIIPNGVKKAIWTMIDVVTTIIDFFNAISAIWAPIGSFISAIVRIFSAIFGIFSFLPF